MRDDGIGDHSVPYVLRGGRIRKTYETLGGRTPLCRSEALKGVRVYSESCHAISAGRFEHSTIETTNSSDSPSLGESFTANSIKPALL